MWPIKAVLYAAYVAVVLMVAFAGLIFILRQVL